MSDLDLLRAENRTLRNVCVTQFDLLQRCLSFLADLNGSNWIVGDDVGSVDMRQRAKALQRLVYAAQSRRD